MDNIKITLETLYDILRNEKKKEDLQKIDSAFYNDVISYLKEKKALLEQKSESDELFAAGEKEKVEYELRSIKRILKELYEKREKKIIDIALNKSRTGSDIIDTNAMMREEKEFYDRLLKTLDLYRRGVLLNLFKGEMPRVVDSFDEIQSSKATSTSAKPAENEVPPVTSPPAAEEEELPVPPQDKPTESSNEPALTAPNHPPLDEVELELKEETSSEEKTEEKPIENKNLKKIKFLHPVPSFVWKDMKVYGPFEEGEETEIFPEVAELLVKKGRAEKL